MQVHKNSLGSGGEVTERQIKEIPGADLMPFNYSSSSPTHLIADAYCLSIQSSVSNLADSNSNLEQDLGIIDRLERERSMDIQRELERERGESYGRQLPHQHRLFSGE